MATRDELKAQIDAMTDAQRTQLMGLVKQGHPVDRATDYIKSIGDINAAQAENNAKPASLGTKLAADVAAFGKGMLSPLDLPTSPISSSDAAAGLTTALQTIASPTGDGKNPLDLLKSRFQENKQNADASTLLQHRGSVGPVDITPERAGMATGALMGALGPSVLSSGAKAASAAAPEVASGAKSTVAPAIHAVADDLGHFGLSGKALGFIAKKMFPLAPEAANEVPYLKEALGLGEKEISPEMMKLLDITPEATQSLVPTIEGAAPETSGAVGDVAALRKALGL